MSSHDPIVDESTGFVAGNYYDKYGSQNPIARYLMNGFLNSLKDLVAQINPTDVHEIGCGEGHLTPILLPRNGQLRGCDVSDKVVDIAKSQATKNGLSASYAVKSIYDLVPEEDRAELVVCCEVLEHLEDPEKGVEILAKLANPYLVTSVPREPIWRLLNMARGKYLTDLGNTPGHLQHWSKSSFINMIRKHFDVLSVKSPLPWTIVLAKARN